MEKFKTISIIAFLFIIVVLVYAKLFNTFYQQDEWNALGHVFASGDQLLLPEAPLFNVLFGHGRILATLLNNAFYRYFPFEIWPFAALAISLHFLNCTLLFLIVRKLLRSNFLGVVAALFLAISSVSTQAVSWAGSITTTLPSAFFAFLSLFYYISFLEDKKRNKLSISFITLILAFYFKESSIFLFFFYPIIYVLFSKAKSKYFETVKVHLPLFLLGLLYVLFRVGDLFFYTEPLIGFINNESSGMRGLFLHALTYPLASISQLFVFPDLMWSIADFFGKISYPRLLSLPVWPIIRETVVLEAVSFLFSFAILIGLFYIWFRDKENRKALVFGLLFTCLSFLPFIPIDKSMAYLESRYFYMGVAGGGILFAVVANFLRKSIPLSLKKASIVVSMPIFLFFIVQAVDIHGELQKLVVLAEERKKILQKLSTVRAALTIKPVFYISGDWDFYIEKGNKIPFQQGTGFTLMVWFYDTGFIPRELLVQNFLWGIADQGYREINGKGFGYFSDITTLKKEIQAGRVDKASVVGFFYEAKEQKLVNITDEVVLEIF